MCDTFISFCETITCVVDSMGSYDYIVIGIMKIEIVCMLGLKVAAQILDPGVGGVTLHMGELSKSRTYGPLNKCATP